MNAVVIYESLTGTTAKAATLIAEGLTQRGLPTRVYAVDAIDYQMLSDAERLARAEAAYHHLRSRRTCRFFTDAPVPRQVIETAILAAGTAPSGANHQPWHFAAIAAPAAKAEVRRLAEEEEQAFYAGKAAALLTANADGNALTMTFLREFLCVHLLRHHFRKLIRHLIHGIFERSQCRTDPQFFVFRSQDIRTIHGTPD